MVATYPYGIKFHQNCWWLKCYLRNKHDSLVSKRWAAWPCFLMTSYGTNAGRQRAEHTNTFGTWQVEEPGVGPATGYGIDDSGSIPGNGKRFFSSPQRPDQLWVPVTVSLGVSQQKRETDHSPPPSTAVKNDGAIPSSLYVYFSPAKSLQTEDTNTMQVHHQC
jgi:hypothetical protein